MTASLSSDAGVLVGAIALSFVLVGIARRQALASGLLALPGERSSHDVPTPAGGGLGMIAALCVAGWLAPRAPALPDLFSSVLLPGGALLSLIGWEDDRRGVSRWLRLLSQLLLAGALLWFLWPPRAGLGVPLVLLFLAALLTLGWVMNAYNFMDGSDGMAGVQGVFSGSMLAWIFAQQGASGWAFASLLVAAVCLGFLPWNLPRARVFMGDAGSVPLGFLLGGLGLGGWLMGLISLPIASLVLAVFLVDASLTLLRRILGGERWYNPHKSHAYQRLLSHGWSHLGVLAVYQGINLSIVVPGMVVGVKYPELAWPVTGLAYLFLVVAWCAVSLKLGERA